jgi:hypothetical protein
MRRSGGLKPLLAVLVPGLAAIELVWIALLASVLQRFGGLALACVVVVVIGAMVAVVDSAPPFTRDPTGRRRR